MEDCWLHVSPEYTVAKTTLIFPPSWFKTLHGTQKQQTKTVHRFTPLSRPGSCTAKFSVTLILWCQRGRQKGRVSRSLWMEMRLDIEGSAEPAGHQLTARRPGNQPQEWDTDARLWLSVYPHIFVAVCVCVCVCVCVFLVHRQCVRKTEILHSNTCTNNKMEKFLKSQLESALNPASLLNSPSVNI